VNEIATVDIAGLDKDGQNNERPHNGRWW